MSSLCILNVNFISETQFANFSSNFADCLFTSLMVSFDVKKLFSLVNVDPGVHFLVHCLCIMCHIKKNQCQFPCQVVLYLFSSGSCIVSGFTFKCITHCELIFVSGVRHGSSFIPLHMNIHLFKHQLLKGLSFLHHVLAPLVKNSLPIYAWVYFGLLIPQSIFLLLCQYHTVLMTVAL